VIVQIVSNSGNQRGHVLKGVTTDSFVGNLAEPSLDHIQPGTRSRDKMQMEPRMSAEPGFHTGMFEQGQEEQIFGDVEAFRAFLHSNRYCQCSASILPRPVARAIHFGRSPDKGRASNCGLWNQVASGASPRVG